MTNATSSFRPGFYENINFADYLADSAVNNSSLKIFSQSPAKFRYWRDNERPGTSTQIEGSGLHCAILEPEKFQTRFGKGPAPRGGSAGRTKWDQKNPVATPLTPRQWEAVEGMTETFKNTSCTVAKDLLTDGTPEMSIFWDDPATGLRSKIRPDWLRTDDVIVDLKSTVNSSPRGFLREVWKWQYQLQAAFYLRGLTAAYRAANVNRQAKAFIFIAVESSPPYEVATYVLSEDIIEKANAQIDETLEKYAECISINTWPGFANEIVILGEDNG